MSNIPVSETRLPPVETVGRKAVSSTLEVTEGEPNYDRLIVAGAKYIDAEERDANQPLTLNQKARIYRSVWRHA